MGKRLAFAGTRGLPASYGGFETAVDHITRRLVAMGYECDVFCRCSHAARDLTVHEGRGLVHVPGHADSRMETVASAVQTGWYLWRHRRQYDHVFWFNNANFPGILIGLLAGIPTTVNTDGLEWKRRKWSFPFKAYYVLTTALISRMVPRLISDSTGIQAFYRAVFRRKTIMIPYGIPDSVPVTEPEQAEILSRFNLQPGKYFLQITRLEPDNLPLDIARGFAASGLESKGYQYVVVGLREETPYALRLKGFSERRPGIRILPAVYDAAILFALRSNCFAYVHGNSVGGTNPALLEALAACPRILAVDVSFNREVLGDAGLFFRPGDLPAVFQRALDLPDESAVLKKRARWYDWDAVADAYRNIVEGQASCEYGFRNAGAIDRPPDDRQEAKIC